MLWLDPGPPFRAVIMLTLAAMVLGKGRALRQGVESWRQHVGEVKVWLPGLLSRGCAPLWQTAYPGA